jgi:hypothetical protein
MMNRRFGSQEPMKKHIQCSCGAGARLIRRRNFPHGRNSKGKSIRLYKCDTCNKESPIKLKEARR